MVMIDMDEDHQNLNEVRFNLILTSLDSCATILHQLNIIDNSTVVINEDMLPNLIDLTNDIDTGLQCSILRGQDYHRLLVDCHSIEYIFRLLPKLEECINDQPRFNEALDLFEQVKCLHKDYRTQVPIITKLFEQSEKLRNKLIKNLTRSLDRPQDFSVDQISTIIEQLFKLGNFSGRELRLKYLQARDVWFNKACEDQVAFFDDVVRVYRDGLPMIFQEYKSIFSDASRFNEHNTSSYISNEPPREDGAIINSWLLMKTSVFISSLDLYLRAITESCTLTPTMLGDTMQRCFELTRWFSTFGFDFSSQLKPLFSKAIARELRASIEKATENFESTFAVIVSKSVESLLLPLEDEILRISDIRPQEKLPESIEHYPVFKIYCLYILDSLRWLNFPANTLSPITLCIDTYEALNSSLSRVTKALATILNIDNNLRHPILTKIAISYITEVLQFLVNSCNRVLPESLILSTIGLSKLDFKTISTSEPEKLKNFRLNLRHIADPLNSTMPALVQTVSE